MLNKPQRIATQKMVAEAVGLSRSTVAAILAGGELASRYNEETCERVLSTARDLNYRPHGMARAMRQGRSNLIGLIHFGGTMETSHRRRVLLAQGIAAAGYSVIALDISGGDGDSRRAIERLLESRVEGVIVVQMIESFGAPEVKILTDAGVPVATVSGGDQWNVPSVREDCQGAIRQMVAHLTSRGHRHLLYLTSEACSWATLNRIRGFEEGVMEQGGTLSSPEAIATEKWVTMRDGTLSGHVVRIKSERGFRDPDAPVYRYMRDLVAKGNLPDAVVCTNDRFARAVFSAVLEAGLSIPGDLAVTGFDNETFGAYAPYFLTSVEGAIEEECLKVVEMLLNQIHGRNLAERELSIPCQLVVRRSSEAKGKPTVVN